MTNTDTLKKTIKSLWADLPHSKYGAEGYLVLFAEIDNLEIEK